MAPRRRDFETLRWVRLIRGREGSHCTFSRRQLAFSSWHLAPERRCAVKDFRNLKVWGKAHALTLEVYKMTARLPREELYGLTSQIRRASASIGANIAEGCGRRGNNEFHRFLQIAAGSASELDYQLLLARDLNFCSGQDYAKLSTELLELRRMLTALVRKVDSERHVG